MNKEWIRFPFYLTVRPFKAYWELKYERNQETTYGLAVIILAALVLYDDPESQYSGFLVNYNDPT